MKKITLFLSIILSFHFIVAQNDIVCHYYDKDGQTREHTVDFKTLTLHIDFDTEKEEIKGTVFYTFQPKRKEIYSLELDAPEIEFKSILLNNKPCKFTTNATSVTLYFNEALTWDKEYNLEISYQAQPKKGLYFYGWNDETNRARKQIWTQGQGIDNRYWIPSFDDVSDKLITETYITFKDGYEVISNGNLISKEQKPNGETTWHYKMDKPHVLYLMMIAIGDYAYKDYISNSGIVNRQYYYPNEPRNVEPTYRFSAEMMDWMEKEFGVNYPWGKIYRNVPVANFLYGAMENTTSTIFTDYYLKDQREAMERDYVGTNAHELTHQWFGDFITEWNGESHWLHESFATHYAKHFKRTVSSENDYQWARYMEMQSAFNADSKNDIPIASSKAGSARHYPKGSMVIDMLRDVAGGDEQYKKVINSYLNKYGFKHVDTHLFELEFMEVLGLNLNWFFDEWIRKGGFPIYEVNYKVKKDSLHINVNQIQKQNETIGLFKMPIDIDVYYTDNTVLHFTEWIEKDTTTISKFIEKNKEIDFIVFDAGNKVYNKLDFKRPTKDALHQALFAKNMIDQYEALKELENTEIKDKRKTLLELYDKATYPILKENIIKQLAKDDNKKSKELITKALQDEDFRVRRRVLYEVKGISEQNKSLYEAMLKDTSFVNIEMALDSLSKQFPNEVSKYLAITEADANKNTNLKIAWLKVAIKNGNLNKLNDLVDLSSNSFEFRTRITAIRTIDDLELVNKKYIYNLISALTNFNRALSSTAKKSLLNLAKNENHKNEILDQIKGSTFNKNEQEKIKGLLDELK